jgi:hypothetical protein
MKARKTASLISFAAFALQIAAFVVQGEQRKAAQAFSADITQGEGELRFEYRSEVIILAEGTDGRPASR